MIGKTVFLILSGLLFGMRSPAQDNHPVIAHRIPDSYQIDQADKKLWKKMVWYELNGCFPYKAQTILDRERYLAVTGYPYPDDQFNQKTTVAVAWNQHGLYIRFIVEDSDVQGNKRTDNDWLWLEDVAEILFAPTTPLTKSHLEFQVNPAGTIFINEQHNTQNTIPEKKGKNLFFRTAVEVNGTINHAADRDRGWIAEFFLPWSTLIAAGLLDKNVDPKTEKVIGKVKFATWDLNTYFLTRINRYLTPGTRTLHDRNNFNPLILR